MRSANLEETYKIASDFVLGLRKGTEAILVGLHGDLGGGKTAFTQGAAHALGITDTIQSPTYVIMKSYDLKGSQFIKFIHIDAYRLESGDELSKLGFKDLLTNSNNLIFLEWPERVAEILPTSMKKINFEFIDETTRDIHIEPDAK